MISPISSRRVRAILDEGGLRDTSIFVSGDLDEWRVAELVATGAPCDGFGVGAALSTSSDAPSLGAVYKLVEIDRAAVPVPIAKRSPGKETYPGRKQVWRRREDGIALEDVIELEGHEPAGTDVRPLLRRVIRAGRRESPSDALSELRRRSRASVAELPASVRRLHEPARYPVRLGSALQAAHERR